MSDSRILYTGARSFNDSINAAPMTMLRAIQAAGQTAALGICLDACDINSMPTSSYNTFNDVSGNGNNFYRGITGPSSNSYTFVGIPGTFRDTFLTATNSDGCMFISTNATLPTWAVTNQTSQAVMTIMAMIYIQQDTAGSYVFTTNAANPGVPGWTMQVGTGPVNTFSIVGSTGAILAATSTSLFFGVPGWHSIGVSVNVPSTTAFFYSDGAISNFSPALTGTTQSTQHANSVFGFMGDTLFTFPFGYWPAATRVGCAAIWSSRALSSGQMDSVLRGIGPRFGL